MKRDRSEWMPLYVDDFDDSEAVALMSPAAEALYQRMLRRQWKHGSLPSNHDALQALFPKFAGDGFDALMAEVRGCFEERDGRLVNATCERVRAEQDAKNDAATRGGRERWKRAQSENRASTERAQSEQEVSERESKSKSEKESQRREEPSSSLRSEPPARKPRRPPEKAGTEITRWWDEEWARTRGAMAPPGAEIAFGWTTGDAVALAKCCKLAGSSEAEVKARTTRLLEDPDPWLAQNATPRLLLSQWNRFTVTIRALSKRDRDREELERVMTEAGVPGARGIPA